MYEKLSNRLQVGLILFLKKKGSVVMKTLNELYTEVAASDALKNEFLALKTPEDIVAFFEEKQKASGELSEEDLEQVAGGKSASWGEGIYSAVTGGWGCGFIAVISILTGQHGKDIVGDGMLCASKGNLDSTLAM